MAAVKEIVEVLEGIKAVGIPAKKILADGKINALDLAHAMDLVKEHQKVIDAIVGVGEIPAEAKDIDAAEAVIIVQKLFEVVKAIKEA